MAVRNAYLQRLRRHRRIRKKVTGTPERPRLCVYRSLKHISVQLVDDVGRCTIASASSMEKDLRQKYGGNVEAAKAVGALIGARAKEKGLTSVVFDRGGYRYAGRVKALADAAREAGLNF
ncbi:MAG: 50S ribosomal protein L18 [Fimbriimonadia bacterium]